MALLLIMCHCYIIFSTSGSLENPVLSKGKALRKNTIKSEIQTLIGAKKYVSVNFIRNGIRKRKRAYKPTTVYQYLFDLKTTGALYDAGRGWYATVEVAAQLDTKPIEKVLGLVRSQFPLLTFAAWSTEQLQPFAHHHMTKFTTFVTTEIDAMAPVAEFLKDMKYVAYVNPQKSEVAKYFTPSSSAVVLRRSITEEPVDGHYATTEKILVDLFLEKDRLNLMDGAEYERIFRNLVMSNRINMPRLLRYADRRKIKTALVKNILAFEHDLIGT